MEIISRKEAKEKGLKRYFTGKPCKYGYIAEKLLVGGCLECKRIRSRKYRVENWDRISEYHKKYNKENQAEIAKRSSEYYKKTIEKSKATKRAYYHANKKSLSVKAKEYYRKNVMQYFIRSTVRRVEDNWRGKRDEMEVLLGYSLSDLKHHLESQFKDGMLWENRSEWHIDHIKPIKAFLDEGITDPKIINALDNLQPLWAHENLSKGAKYDE